MLCRVYILENYIYTIASTKFARISTLTDQLAVNLSNILLIISTFVVLINQREMHESINVVFRRCLRRPTNRIIPLTAMTPRVVNR